MAITSESFPLMNVADVERKAITNNLHPISTDSFDIECGILQLLSNFADSNSKVRKILSSLNDQPTLESIMYIVCELVELVNTNMTKSIIDSFPTSKRINGITKANAATDIAQIICAWCSGEDTIINVKEPSLCYFSIYNIPGLKPPIMSMESGVKIITILEKSIIAGQLTYTISGIIAGMKITNAMNKSSLLLKIVTDTVVKAEEEVVEDKGCFPCWARKKVAQ